MSEALKDERLNSIATTHNVARFVSFDSGTSPRIRFCRLDPAAKNGEGIRTSPEEAVSWLVRLAGSVNVRAFRSVPAKGSPFHYGLTAADDVLGTVRRLAADGYYTIVNETIDVHDGGVSGVVLGGAVEVAPDDTPRAVESAGAFSASQQMAFTVLKNMYGFVPDVPTAADLRVEFSVHPGPVGLRRGHTLVWEIERIDPVALAPAVSWPNRLSRFLGDKAFGLLIADAIGLAVPETTVISRRVAPFRFGSDTGSLERWFRTCPVEPDAGKYTTTSGWSDPFHVLAAEDPTGTAIPSVLSQQGVHAAYSGATLPGSGDEPDTVQGVAGRGDRFMQGLQEPEPLPEEVTAAVRAATAAARAAVGPVRCEWAHDGRQVWILQLHLAAPGAKPGVINPGEAEKWLRFDPASGLDALRGLVARAVSEGAGVLVTGPIGTTSHVGDILRKAGVPARIVTTPH